MDNTDPHRQRKRAVLVLTALLSPAVCALTAFGIYFSIFIRSEPPQLTGEQTAELSSVLASDFYRPVLAPLPYRIVPADLPLACGAAIVIDADNGSILYEKNADEIIPPASMTKLVVMYIVFKEIQSGRISMSDTVPLPPESWAENLPPDSSLMFLGAGQTVTVGELLKGLAVASGNDAAIAVACHISGSVEAFCLRMNDEMAQLGLARTHFVEPSGYDERNVTTPREFAAFSKIYIEQFPEALKHFHSAAQIAYPQAHNLPPYQDPQRNIPIVQYNTNKALGQIEGCDGLKTGFIYESGYNLAYTVNRGGTRFIAVFMKGYGRNTAEGNKYRLENCKTVTDWAYRTFATRRQDGNERRRITSPVFGGSENALSLIPAYQHSLTVPAIIEGKTPEQAAQQVKTEDIIAGNITAPVEAGAIYGKRVYSLDGYVLEEIPLVADRSIKRGGPLKRAADGLVRKLIRAEPDAKQAQPAESPVTGTIS